MLVVMSARQSGTAMAMGSLLLGTVVGCVGMPLGGADGAGPLPGLTAPVTLAEVKASWNLTADASNLYWTTDETHYGDLASVSQRGGPASVIAPATGFHTLMGSADGWIYGTDSTTTTLWRLPAAGGEKQVFVEQVGWWCEVGAVTAGAVWCGFGVGLARIDLGTRAPVRVGSSGGYNAQSLAVDRDHTYWTAGGELLAVDHRGGPTRVLLGNKGAGPTWANLVAADDRWVFAATGQSIVRIDPLTGRAATLRAGLVTALAVRHGMVFWADAVTGDLGATPEQGGPDVVVERGEAGQVRELVATDLGLFWFGQLPLYTDRGLLRGAYFTFPP